MFDFDGLDDAEEEEGTVSPNGDAKASAEDGAVQKEASSTAVINGKGEGSCA
eukprot:CAMPEP_0171120926 /NCGR_PEP_ID=MMETSP0766_2-20121228/101030_1 /TAXON_ID=439317 /ORGANISM="Gambierdiscus australes, Strain CAWD 149" /LENGTH=51 /DNA_ID=CAMNT_0011583687 /DNA_START=15 /DNA_END=166 /DNA_ORIENTATION=+